jgi:hypothetical protein
MTMEGCGALPDCRYLLHIALVTRSANTRRPGPVQCRERLGGLLRYYHQEAA